jgi:hypothetical protein
MSVIKVNNITNRDGTSGPVIAGIATVSSTSHMVVPSGNTRQRVGLAPDPYINNLVLALPFNSESVFTDVSPKGNGDPSISGISITSSLPFGVSGVTTTSSGIVTFSKYYGSSLYIDGSNDYLAFQNSSSFNVLNESYTIEMWINPFTMVGNNGMLLTLYNESSNRGSYFTRIDSTGFVRFGENSTGSVGGLLTLDTPTGIVTSGVWYHLAFVKDAPSQTKAILVNGVVRASIGSTGTVPSVYSNTQDPLMIGAFNLLSSPSVYFNGYMQDIRMYKGIAKYNIVGIATGTTVFTPPNQIAL